MPFACYLYGMKIYTKTGDKGQTSLIGGTRIPKFHLRIECYGTVDELNSYIGLIRDQDIDQRRFKVSYIDPQGPAAKTELKVGDVIISVDGYDVTGARFVDGWTLMRAPPGTALKLGLARDTTMKLVLAEPIVTCWG